MGVREADGSRRLGCAPPDRLALPWPMRRFLLYIVLPALAIAGPPLALAGWKWWKAHGGRLAWPALAISSSGQSPSNSENEDAILPGQAPWAQGSSPAAPGASPAQPPDPSGRRTGATGPDVPAIELAEAIRFDITPGWVMTRWPRVSAGLAELQLQGYRVPLVTGTAEDDLAGALTYYFNPWQQVERITFRGTTGNAGKLIEYLVRQYRFGRRLTNDPRIVRFEVPGPRGEPHSWLEIRPAGVVKASEPFQRLSVVLVLNRPNE